MKKIELELLERITIALEKLADWTTSPKIPVPDWRKPSFPVDPPPYNPYPNHFFGPFVVGDFPQPPTIT